MKYIKKYEVFNENIYVGLDVTLEYPSYLTAEDEDTIDIAFDKGTESFIKGASIEANPYFDVHEDMVVAWNDGFMNAEDHQKDMRMYN